MQDKPDDFGAGLIDVTGLSLHDLDAISESSLADALRQVLGDDQSEPVAGFQSSF
jgi:FXSXX-COOH protein